MNDTSDDFEEFQRELAATADGDEVLFLQRMEGDSSEDDGDAFEGIQELTEQQVQLLESQFRGASRSVLRDATSELHKAEKEIWETEEAMKWFLELMDKRTDKNVTPANTEKERT